MREEYAFTTTHHLPFANPSPNAHPNHERMDLLIVHLSGPMSTPTWAGKTRVLVAVEMGSQLSVGGLLETENDAAGALKTIVMRLEKESGRTLKKIYTDTGNVYLHAVVDAFCKRNQILHGLPPENEQNGVAAPATATYPQKVKKYASTSTDGRTLLGRGVPIRHPYPKPPTNHCQHGQSPRARLDRPSTRYHSSPPIRIHCLRGCD
jgi:hypothetical protein